MCDHDIKSDAAETEGSKVEHGKAHEKAHKDWSRRSFLRGLGITGGMGLVLGQLPVNALSSSPLSVLLDGANSDRILVMIRLKGGNDGLNTLVPLYNYDTYRTNRPQLAKSESDVIKLSDEHGLNSNLAPLMPLWNEGKMKIVNGVGYDNHNLSHFRSTDIITSGSDANVVESSGWLGRHLNDCFPDFLTNPPAHPPAVQIAGAGSILFSGGEGAVEDYALSVASPEQLFEIAKTGRLYELDNLPECTYGEQLGFLRSVANSTFRYAEVIKEKYDEAENDVAYTTALGQQLGLVARLIKGGLKTQFYVVTLDGFDTHADQENSHDRLMAELSGAVSNFFEDLRLSEKDDDVLAMTFSEFGRRVQENASAGTDHGTASPTMMFGPSLNGNGFIGTNPNLDDLDSNENLKFTTDFRQIYATVLEEWLCIDAAQVNALLYDDFERLALGLECEGVSTVNESDFGLQVHNIRYDAAGKAYVYYELAQMQYVKIEIFNISGQLVTTLQNGRQTRGSYTQAINLKRGLAMAPYVYRLSVNGKGYSRTFSLHRT